MTEERVWLVHKRDYYRDCKDANGYFTRRNFPEVTVDEVIYSSPLDLAFKLNEISDLERRLNKDYVYTDYDLAVKEADRLRSDK
jgi:hypothetical protein